MTLRSLIALLLLTTLGILLTFIGLILFGTIGDPGQITTSLLLRDANAAAYSLWILYVLLFALLNIFIFFLLYLFLDRLIVRPIRLITAAMADFALTQQLGSLPPFKNASKEIQSFAKSFVSLTASFQEVHTHDMEVSRVKSDFISTAAHQLRTPLTGIRWALEALEKEPLTESQTALVASAVEKSHDLVAVVKTLLDISSIESGKHKYDFASLDLDALVTEIVSDFKVLGEKTNVSVLYKKPDTVLSQVRADKDQIKWVLNNLIENAIRYTPSGGSVQVYMTVVPYRVQVRVRDTGIGIDTKDRNNIFERFYRAGNAIAKENAGNGLGLYIARRIATDHGGDLNFESNAEGPGTTFTLSIPTIE